MKKARKPKRRLQWFPAKLNDMFSPELTALVRFVRSDKPMACAHCGRKIRIGDAAWTCLVPFRVMDWGTFALKPANDVTPALAPICGKHCWKPELSAAAIGCGSEVVDD